MVVIGSFLHDQRVDLLPLPAYCIEQLLGSRLREIGKVLPWIADPSPADADVAHQALALRALVGGAVEVADRRLRHAAHQALDADPLERE